MVSAKSLSLHPLSESPIDGVLPLQWSLDLWGNHIPGYTPLDWVNFYEGAKSASYEKWSGAGQELIYIGRQEGQVVGAIALVDFDDLEEFRHLSPWVAGFIVDPQRRGEGQGEQMLTLLEGKA